MSQRQAIERSLCLSLALVFLLPLAACQKVIGLEDRKLLVDAGNPDAAVDEPDSPACLAYCSEVLKSCTGDFAAYRNPETCLAVCKRLPPGDAEDPTGNTLACRADEAKAAPAEPDFHCPRAGPGGDGECGSNCESYCQLFEAICPSELVNPDCERLCTGLRDNPGFDAVKDFAEGTDDVQCRLAHLSAAAFGESEIHCGHAQLVPGANSPCSLKDGTEPSCKDYCRLVNVTCRDELAVYESVTQCEKACAALDLGEVGDLTGDSVACRRYHSYASMVAPDNHCKHASFGGDGHCGKICPVYCKHLDRVCGAGFAETFATQQACEEACLQITDDRNADVGFSVEVGADENAIECRLLELVRAAAGDQTACEGALGRAPCN